MTISNPRRVIWFLISAVFAFSGCATSIPEKGTPEFDEAVSRFYIGLAAVQVGNDQRAAEELEKAATLAAGEPAVWNNLGVLQLRQKDYESASASLEKAKKLAPDSSRIFFNLALLALQNNDSESLNLNLQKARELDPEDLRPLYLLALENEKQKKDKEALAAFDEILKAQPENLAALIESARLKAKAGDEKGLREDLTKLDTLSGEWPEAATIQFAKLNQTPVAQAATEIAFLRTVLLRYPAFRASIAKIKPSDIVIGELMTKPLKLEAPDFAPAEPDTEITFETEYVTENRVRFSSVVFPNGSDSPLIAVSNEKETSIGEATLPFSAASSEEIAVIDFDYDFKNDIAYAGKHGIRLFRQLSNGRFENITHKTGIPASIVDARYGGIWSFDFDNEGDLDLLVDAGSTTLVLRNNGNGSFEVLTLFGNDTRVSDFEYADLDEDGDSDAVLTSGNTLELYKNERGGIFRQDEKATVTGVDAFAVGDTDGDGSLDLIILDQARKLYRNRPRMPDGVIPGVESISVDFESCEPRCRLEIADIDNNGANDILVSSGKESIIFLGTAGGKFEKAKNGLALGIDGVADFNGDGKLDLIGVDREGKPVKLINKSTKDYHWQIVRPKAAKTEGDQRINSFGIGGEIETRAGLAVQKQLIRSPQVHFGLGNAKQTDFIRVVWQNGYVQAEFDIKTNQTIAAEQRLKGSCPHLFAWNGEEFAHVKDAPPWSPALGLKINAQDTYGILQTEEWFKIPGNALKPKDGSYELRITGEYWEAFYIDQYRLMAVDHPEDTEVFTDERFAIPLPPLEVFTTKKTKLFKSAVDHNGKDVMQTISSVDEKYLDDIKRGKYQGVAEDHFVELELPDDAPRDKKLWIVADGWVHPTDASINVQRGQDVPRPPKSLSIEVQDKNGEWRAAKENLGFPAGKMKTVLLDLDGVFPKGQESRKLRLRTEMEVFWDKLAWAVAVEGESNITIGLSLDSAELRYRGFSVIEKPNDSSPEVPDYKRILTKQQRWRDLVGYYTRYGDVKELLEKTDDRFVLSNAGDEIILTFKALPPVKRGFVRDYVIIGNGWIKDGDLNSVYSKTVLPLPTHASNDYTRPPTTLEEDPVYARNREDWAKFHTRFVAPDNFRNAVRNTSER